MGRRTLLLVATVSIALLLGLALLPSSVWGELRRWLALITDRDWIRTTIVAYGWAAPLVFIAIQVAQVLAAPVPGEATGFIGGYLFGTLPGFFYSSVGLGIGSLINFAIGRFLGERFVRRLIPQEKFKRIDRLINRQGIIAVFLMFVIPGFPKDYLSLALGLSTLPFRVFAVLAFIGRMPGTLVLSLQGASLYDRNYGLLAAVAAACLALALLAYLFREPIYRWVEKINPPRSSAGSHGRHSVPDGPGPDETA
jgi:uncharacterized membrane protein YdjX (TVP38/TMEM64 family)